MTDTNDPGKASIRATMRARLAELDAERMHAASVSACRRLIGLEAFDHASVVMLYMPLAREVDVTAAAIRCFQLAKTVCVPRVDWERRDMAPIEITTFDDHVMDTDAHGVRTPREGRLVLPAMIDFLVVPGLAFDLLGRRLGRGGGYYDRFLGRLRRSALTVGIAFDEQIIDEVPVDDRDMSVDVVVTDRRLAHARPSRSKR